MTRAAIEQALTDLNQLVVKGRLIDAFEKYYHEDVAMQENNLPPTISKSANREREMQFLANVTEFRSASAEHVAVGDNISYVTWTYDYTHAEWGIRQYTQISIQEWKEGKIIRERFIYSN